MGHQVTDPRVARRSSFRTLAIVAFVVLLPLAAHAVWDQIEATRLARVVKQLRARGEIVDRSDERRPLATDEERQASRLYYAAAMLAADGIPKAKTSPSGAMSNPRLELAAALQELARVPGLVHQDDPRLRPLKAVVQNADAAFILLDRATPLPFERFSPERGTYSYQTSDLMQLASLNALRTDLYSLQGDVGKAAAAQFASVRLQRTLKGLRWMLYPGTFGSLQLLLRRTMPDPQSLARLQDAYEHLANDDGLADDLTDRRAQMIESVWPTTARPFFAQRLGTPWQRQWSNESLTFVALRPWITHQFIARLKELDRAIAIAREGWPDKLSHELLNSGSSPAVHQAMTPMPGWVSRVMSRSGVGLLVPPAGEMISGGTISRAGRTLAQNRTSVAALAIERWRRAHGGAAPPSLEALVPEYARELPRDPFTGVALKFVRAGDSYTVYSVGIDRVDNGGDIDEWRPDVRSYSRATERDIGIRVPLRLLQ